MKGFKEFRRVGLFLLGLLVVGGAIWYRNQADASLSLQEQDLKRREQLVQKIETLQSQLSKLEKAVAKTPQDVELRWRLSDAYQSMGQVERTKEQLKLIAKLSPKDVSPYIALANLELAQKNLIQAEVIFRQATQRFPKSPDAWQGLSATLFHQNRFLEAMEASEKAIKHGPRDPSNAYLLASAAMEYGLQFPDPQLHSQALSLSRAKFISLLKVWPQQGSIYYDLGRVCVGLRDSQNALKYLRRAIEIEPQRAESYFLLARVLNVAGSPKAARGIIEQGLQKNPHHAGLQALNGQLLQVTGQADSAQKSFESFRRAVEAEPNNPAYREKYGIACLRLGKLEQARQQFEEALRLKPSSTVPYQQLAAIYTRLGKPEKATKFATTSTGMFYNDNQLKQIHGLAKLHRDSVPLHLILADRYRDLGLTGAARDQYLYVLRLDAKNKRAKAGAAKLLKVLLAQNQKKPVSQTTIGLPKAAAQ